MVSERDAMSGSEFMKVYTDTPEGVTVVRNTFIDQFMPRANGEYVKVYLYLLRCANTGRDLSLASIADVLEHTESDIRRALIYWEKQDLIHLKTNVHGDLLSITFSDLPYTEEPADDFSAETDPHASSGMSPETLRMAKRAAEYSDRTAVKSYGQTAAEESGAASSEPASVMSREQLAALSEQKDIRQLFFIAEQYLQRTLTSSEQAEFIYYYDTLHFSVDLIEYLIEYCISKGTFSRHYMRKVALAWAEAGIKTVLQAKQESSLYNKNYYTILNAFGIKGRGPAPTEVEIMSGWLNEEGYSLELILEACSRTIRQIHQPSFEYADKILKNWKEDRVVSLADVKRLDQQRTEEQQKRRSQKNSYDQKQGMQQGRTSGNRFNNFSQRDYDYRELEKQLLGK